MNQKQIRILALSGVLAFVTVSLVAIEALAWNKCSVQYHSVLLVDGMEKEVDSSLFLNGATTQYLSLGGESYPVSANDGYGYKFVRWSDGSTESVRSDRPWVNAEYTAYFTYDYGGLPFLFNDDGKLKLVSKEGTTILETSADVMREEVKTGYPAYKYPYRLTFDGKETFFDMTSDSFQLLPLQEDPTLLRDLFAYELSDSLSFETKTEGELVLFMDEGSYAGVCLLSPNFLPTSPFAFESGNTESIGLETLDGRYFGGVNISGEKYGIPDHFYKISKTQPYVSSYVIPHLYDRIFLDGSYEAVSSMLDLPSAVDAYLLAEYMKHTTIGQKGVLMEYRDGEVIFLAETSFSVSAGLDSRTDVEGSLFDIDLSNRDVEDTQYILYGLSKLDWFNELVRNRWKELSSSGVIEQAISSIRSLAKSTGEKLSADKEKYPFYSVSNEMRVQEWKYYDGEIKKYSYDEHVESLVSWLTQRKTVLDQMYGVKA